MAQNLKTITLRTTIIYAILAGLWILISDWTIYLLVDEPTTLTQLQTYKGLFYVVVTSLILYVLLRAQLRNWVESVTIMEQTRQSLSASNDYLKAVLDATSDAILVIDPTSGIIIDANQRVYEMYGYALEELIDKPMTNLSNIAEDYTLKKVYRWAAQVRREGPQVMEWKTRHKNGYLFWVEIGLRCESIGEKERFVMSVRDINHRKKIEDDLKESQRMLDTLVSNLPGMVYRCKNTPDWAMTYVSQGVFGLTGYRPEDLIGENNISFNQLIHPEDRQKDWDEIQRAVQMQRPYTLTYRLIDVSNIEKWVWEQGRGVFDENDQLLFLEGFIIDISEQKKNEHELRTINTRLSVLINSTPDIICFKDGENRWLEANRADLELFKLSNVDYRGKTDSELADYTAPIYREAFLKCEESDELAWKKGTISRGEEIIPTPDGGEKVYDVIKAPTFAQDGSRTGLIVFGRDITERKKAEALLRMSEQTYQGILASVTEAVYIQDKKGNFIYVNQAAEKMEGYTLNEIIGQTQKLLAAPGKNNLEAIETAIQNAYSGKSQQFEFWGMRKNGEIFPQEVSLTQGWYFGKKVVVAVARDITARKKAEQALYKRLAELEALRTIDRAITSSFELRITLDILLKQAVHKLEVDAAAVMLLDSDLQTLRYAAAQGFRTFEIESMQFRPGQGLAGKVMLERQSVQVSNKAEIENDKIFAKQEEFCGYCGIPLIAKGELKGILEIFHRASLPEDPDWNSFLETLANQTAIAIDNAQMFESLQHKNLELALAYDAIIEGWSRALELREGESPGHSERISLLTIRLAQALDLGKDIISSIRHGVLLHDIGKMGIPDEILLKKGKLTREERKIIEQHPRHAYTLLSNISHLKYALDIPYHHHEKWDGTGYPDGLSGDQIPLAARIFAVVDVWDALTSDRPYRKAWTRKKATAYLREQRGKHFDPKILDVFLNLIATEEGD